MRISTQELYSANFRKMQYTQESINELQAQIASGIKLSQSSQNPSDFSKVMRYSDEINLSQQYKKNIDFASGRNALIESNLGEAVNTMQKLQELTVAVSNDTLNATDRKGVAVEIRELQKQLADIMNSRDGAGDFLFSGYQGKTQPFVERSSGGFDYYGDDGQRLSNTSKNSKVAVSDSGKDLFVDVSSDGNTIVTRASSANASTASISIGQIIDQPKFDSFFPEDYKIVFGDPAEHQNRQTFSIVRASDGAAVFGTSPPGYLTEVTYESGMPIEFNGVKIEVFGDPAPGDTFTVESSGQQSILNTIERLARALEDAASSATVRGDDISLIGRASAPRQTLNNAGNYIAAQTIKIKGDDGSVQTLSVTANQSTQSIATALNALNGVTASANPTTAELDFSASNIEPGDVIEFSVNGQPISAIAGQTNTDTFTAIDTALAAVFGGGNLTYLHDGAGRFNFTESTGENISIADFEVIDYPRTSLEVETGIAPGDTINFDITGSAGETVNVNYTAVSGDTDELFAAINADVTAAGLGAIFNVTQAAAGQPAQIRYLGDPTANGSFEMSGLTDSGGLAASLKVNSTTGSNANFTGTTAGAGFLRPGFDVTVTPQDGRNSVAFSGALGDPVSLYDNGSDSSSVAATLSISMDAGYTIESSIESAYGGLVGQNYAEPADNINKILRSALDRAMGDLDLGQENLIRARSRTGSRLNGLDAMSELNQSSKIEMESARSKLRDLDYAQAFTELNLQSFVLQASQNSFVKISRLSLFNYL
ncbi:MAG: flagellar hook-associated protein FlgL [Pseudomonadota bacterium]